MNPSYDASIINNQSIDNMRNHDYMYNLFGSYFQQTQNSIISQCFYNIEKCEFKSKNCPPIYYYTFKTIFIFNVEQYRMYRDQCNFQKMGMNLSIEECLKCYQGGYSKMCDLCKSSDGSSYENIFSTTKILIFYFKRNNHLFKGDIDFNMKLEMYNKTYNLKACISSYSNQKYFSDKKIIIFTGVEI